MITITTGRAEQQQARLAILSVCKSIAGLAGVAGRWRSRSDGAIPVAAWGLKSLVMYRG
ncbi:MAG TPA: hypothetical protein VF162_17175 [Streptosporangiaceae bacterium]